jgi:hypothetical protein
MIAANIDRPDRSLPFDAWSAEHQARLARFFDHRAECAAEGAAAGRTPRLVPVFASPALDHTARIRRYHAQRAGLAALRD